MQLFGEIVVEEAFGVQGLKAAQEILQPRVELSETLGGHVDQVADAVGSAQQARPSKASKSSTASGSSGNPLLLRDGAQCGSIVERAGPGSACPKAHPRRMLPFPSRFTIVD